MVDQSTARTILVAEDDDAARALVSKYLEAKGHRVRAVADGQAVLDALEAYDDIDLVLLDVMMPKLSGFDVLEQARARGNMTPIIMATAASSQKWRRPAASGPPADDIGPGSLIAERYVIESQIGSGGFGEVWRARHVDLGQDVAIKVLHHDISRANVAEFRLEAQKACRVRHDNAVRVYDFGYLPQGSAYLVMELLEGPTLEQMIRVGAPLPVERCLTIMRPVLAALAAAHKHGIVHRDVKPANVVLHREDEREVPKLLDFGIAKNLDDARHDSGGMIVGSPAYIAPERLRGTPYDGRSDVYACGIMLHRMLTGVLPFDETLKDFEKVALWHVSAPPTPPSIANPSIARRRRARRQADEQGPGFSADRPRRRGVDQRPRRRSEERVDERRDVRDAAGEREQHGRQRDDDDERQQEEAPAGAEVGDHAAERDPLGGVGPQAGAERVIGPVERDVRKGPVIAQPEGRLGEAEADDEAGHGLRDSAAVR